MSTTPKGAVKVTLDRHLNQEQSDRILKLMKGCSTLEADGMLKIMPGSLTLGGEPVPGLISELNDLLHGHQPTQKCKYVL